MVGAQQKNLSGRPGSVGRQHPRKPLFIPFQGPKSIGTHLAVGHHHLEKSGILHRLSQGPGRGRRVHIPEEERQLPVGLQLGKPHLADIKDPVEPQILEEIVQAEPQLPQGPLVDVPIPDDGHGPPGDQPPKGRMFQRHRRNEHLCRDERQHRDGPVDERNIQILHRDRRHR